MPTEIECQAELSMLKSENLWFISGESPESTEEYPGKETAFPQSKIYISRYSEAYRGTVLM